MPSDSGKGAAYRLYPLRLTPAMIERMGDLAKRQPIEVTKAALVRRALELGLDQLERDLKEQGR